MSEPIEELKKPEISRVRFVSGTVVFVFGLISPVFIPLITSSDLSFAWKSGISGFMAFGLPEVLMLLAVAIMGKEGYTFLKSKIGMFFKPFAPKQKVGVVRYRIGLVLFTLPLLVGWALPYGIIYFHEIPWIPFWVFMIFDGMFIASFFVLGGEFWDKFRLLFVYNSKQVPQV